MGFDWNEGSEAEKIRFGPAVCMAVFDELGIAEAIDSACEWDPQRILSPGNAAKAICATMFTENLTQAMHNVRLFHDEAPVDRLFGPRVSHESLSDAALGRALETIFAADTERLFYTVAARARGFLATELGIVHFDPTNFTVSRSPGDPFEGLPENCPVPKLGHPKDGRTERIQYNVMAAVDGTGLPVYSKTMDGNTGDPVAIARAARFVEDMLGDRRMIAVADSKMTSKDLVGHMLAVGTHFVTKPQEKFADGLKGKAVEEAFADGAEFVNIGRIGVRSDSPEVEVFETAVDPGFDTAGHGKLRVIVTRKADRAGAMAHTRRLDAKALEQARASLKQERFATEEEAAEALSEAVRGRTGVHDVRKTVIETRGWKGRIAYRADFTYRWNEARAERAAARDVEVLVTSLPRSAEDSDDPSRGASARDVVRIYRGQWGIEGMFRSMKSGLGADTVFLQNPQREDAMVFLVMTALLVRTVVRLRMRSAGSRELPTRITTERMLLLVQNTRVCLDRREDRAYLSGSPDGKHVARAVTEALGIDPERLLGPFRGPGRRVIGSVSHRRGRVQSPRVSKMRGCGEGAGMSG